MNISPLLDDDQLIRDTIYQGKIYLFEANETSEYLVERINEELQKTFGENPRKAQFEYTDEEYFTEIGKLRKLFYTTPEYIELAKKLMEEFGFDTEENAIDPIRIRVIQHEGHLNPQAVPIYHGHRDTWYSNPQNQITWWIPLHDIEIEESFEFYPEYFEKAVKNDSEAFDYDVWMARGTSKKIGWQNKDTGWKEVYPRLMEEVTSDQISVKCKKGQILVFAGQHLHRTIPNITGKTRFSVDFRSVHKEDYEKQIMPKNVDNRSIGSSFKDHV